MIFFFPNWQLEREIIFKKKIEKEKSISFQIERGKRDFKLHLVSFFLFKKTWYDGVRALRCEKVYCLCIQWIVNNGYHPSLHQNYKSECSSSLKDFFNVIKCLLDLLDCSNVAKEYECLVSL